MVRAVAALVAASALYSRVASFVLLALGARILSLHEFGVMAVAVGAAVAVANIFAVGAGDQIAAEAVKNRSTAWRFMLRSGVLLMAGAAVFSIPAFAATSTTVGVLTTSIATCASTAACMTAMNYLRGCGSAALGSFLGYVLLPTLRTVAVAGLLPLDSTTLLSVMVAVNVASSTAALAALAIASIVSRHQEHILTTKKRNTATQAVLLGTSVALAWAILSQGDVTALAIFRGTTVAGQYTPTMRVTEALSALALGVKFAGTRHIVANSARGLEARILLLLAAAYSVGTALMILVAPAILSIAFGESYQFNYHVALILAAAYFVSGIVSLLLQLLIARGAGQQVALRTAIVIFFSVVLLVAGAATGGEVGVAIAVFLIFSLWCILLFELEHKSRDGHCPCPGKESS